MSNELSKFLKLYTFQDNTQEFLSVYQFTNQNLVQFKDDDIFQLTSDLHKDFQYACIDIAELNDKNTNEIYLRNQNNERIEKLKFTIASRIDQKIIFSNKELCNSHDLASKLLEEVFNPLVRLQQSLKL